MIKRSTARKKKYKLLSTPKPLFEDNFLSCVWNGVYKRSDTEKKRKVVGNYSFIWANDCLVVNGDDGLFFFLLFLWK